MSVIRAAELATGTAVARHLADVPIPMAADGLVTGGDIHPEATRLVLRTYFAALEYRVPAGGPFEAVFEALPEELCRRYANGAGELEAQGKAIAYAADGRSVWTTSEGQGAPLNRRPCEP